MYPLKSRANYFKSGGGVIEFECVSMRRRKGQLAERIEFLSSALGNQLNLARCKQAALLLLLPALPSPGLADAHQSDDEKRSSLSTAMVGALALRSSSDEQGSLCPADQWESGVYSMTRNGFTRRFRVHVPANYDPSIHTPLIVAFHGWGGDEDEFLGNAAVRSNLDQTGLITVAPVGLGPGEPDFNYASWSFSGSSTGLDGDGVNSLVAGDTAEICDASATPTYTYGSCSGVAANTCSWTHCLDNDIEFALDLVEEVSNNLCIDPDRVFAVGGSNGGMFTWDLVRDSKGAEVFAATASLTGLPHRGHLEPPASTGGKPALLITGTNDRTVPPGAWGDERFTTTTDGDVFYYASATSVTKVWAEAAGCDVTSSATPFDVGVDELECRAWSGCAADSEWPPVLDCRRAMGHVYGLSWSWPLITDFFSRVSAEQ